MSLQLLEVVNYAAVDDRHDVDDASHDVILHEDVALRFDDASMTAETDLFIFNHGVLGLCLMMDF